MLELLLHTSSTKTKIIFTAQFTNAFTLYVWTDKVRMLLHEGEEDKYQNKGEELECVVVLREGPELG